LTVQTGNNPTSQNRHYRPHPGEARPLNITGRWRRNDLTTPGSNPGDVITLPTAGKLRIYGMNRSKVMNRRLGDFSNVNTVQIAIEAVAAILKRAIDFDCTFENTDNVKRVLKVQGKSSYKLPQTFYSLTGLETDRSISPASEAQRQTPFTTVRQSRVQPRATTNHFVATTLTFHVVRLQADYNEHVKELMALAHFAHWQHIAYEVKFTDGLTHYATVALPESWSPSSIQFEEGSREPGVSTLEFDIVVKTILIERETLNLLQRVRTEGPDFLFDTDRSGSYAPGQAPPPGIDTQPQPTRQQRSVKNVLDVLATFEQSPDVSDWLPPTP
jgi:hypothetical protein